MWLTWLLNFPIEILVKSEILRKNRKFWGKIKILTKIEVLSKNLNFGPK